MKLLIFSEKAVLPEPEGPARPTCKGAAAVAAAAGGGLPNIACSSWPPCSSILLASAPWCCGCCRANGAAGSRDRRRPTATGGGGRAAAAAYQGDVFVVLGERLDGPDEDEEALVKGELRLDRLDGEAGAPIGLFQPHQLQLVLEQGL